VCTSYGYTSAVLSLVSNRALSVHLLQALLLHGGCNTRIFLSFVKQIPALQLSKYYYIDHGSRSNRRSRARGEQLKKDKRINNFSSPPYFSYIMSTTVMLVAYFKVLFRDFSLEMPKVATKHPPPPRCKLGNLTTYPQLLFFSLTILSNDKRTD
jgi:hypothetical protein